jgi:hypothetical protein
LLDRGEPRGYLNRVAIRAKYVAIVDKAPNPECTWSLLACPHPEHRRGTRGGLRRNQEVCMNCGEVVLKRSR